MRSRFLTPNITDLDSSNVRRFFVCPSELAKYLTGALDVLCHGYNWEVFGDASVADTVDAFENVLASMGNCMEIGTIYATVAKEPDYALELNGQSVDERDYPELAAIVPTSWLRFGNINLPDMNLRTLAGNGRDQIGDMAGEHEHTLTIDEMPAHSHETIIPVASVASLVPPDAIPSAVEAPGSTSVSGSGSAHNNMPPYLAIRWLIVAK